MSVRVRDLEIALVLAREMKAAAARSVDASLRLDQLQEVFGVEELDRAERARIQTALQMAGLEPFPSLLEADPSEPIRFGASKAAATATAAGSGAAAAPPPEEPPAADPPTFPTVGQFARSKLRRSRRFGVRRGDHGDDDARPREAVAAEDLLDVDDLPDVDELPPPVPAEEPLYRHGDALAEEAVLPEDDATRVHEVPAEYAEANGHIPDQEQPEAEAALDDEPDAVEEPAGEAVEEPVEEIDEEPLPEDHVDEPHAEDEREYIPLVPEQPVGYAEPEPAPEPAAPQPAGARTEDVVAVLLPAVAIPVIVTSIAGWRFGLPFVALSVVATGVLLSRRPDSADGRKRGLLATLRGSPATPTALKTTVVVTLLSVVASVVLASVGKESSSTSSKTAAPAKKPQGPAAAAPTQPPVTAKPTKPKSRRHKPSSANSGPPPDPATQGLVRVPPSSSRSSNRSGTSGGTGTQPSTGTQPGTGTGTGSQPSTGTAGGTGSGPGAGSPQPKP